jgi:hypothetical protein
MLLMMVNGAADPLVPYDGGKVGWVGGGGTFWSVEQMAEFFARLNGCGKRIALDLPSRGPSNGTSVTEIHWPGGNQHPPVTLYRINRGSNLIAVPALLFGRTTSDISAADAIMSAFARARRRASAGVDAQTGRSQWNAIGSRRPASKSVGSLEKSAREFRGVCPTGSVPPESHFPDRERRTQRTRSSLMEIKASDCEALFCQQRREACVEGGNARASLKTEGKPIFSPAYMGTALTAMVGINVVAPGGRLLSFTMALTGLALIVVGIALNLAADHAFKARGTTVKPFERSRALVTTSTDVSRHGPDPVFGVRCCLGLGRRSRSSRSFARLRRYLAGFAQPEPLP